MKMCVVETERHLGFFVFEVKYVRMQQNPKMQRYTSTFPPALDIFFRYTNKLSFTCSSIMHYEI